MERWAQVTLIKSSVNYLLSSKWDSAYNCANVTAQHTLKGETKCQFTILIQIQYLYQLTKQNTLVMKNVDFT